MTCAMGNLYWFVWYISGYFLPRLWTNNMHVSSADFEGQLEFKMYPILNWQGETTNIGRWLMMTIENMLN